MLIKKLIKTVKRFRLDEAGNYTLIAALALPAILGSVSVAVEMSSVSRSRTMLQNALDISALATGKHLSITTDEDVLHAYARSYFDANLNGTLDSSKITFGFNMISPNNAGRKITLTANYDYPVYMKYLGKDELLLEITSQVTAGNKTIEVAIVLDNSGSMDNYTGSSSDTRIEKATEAATDLSTQLFALANISNKPDPVKISIVPFASSVNIGAANSSQDWMDQNGWSSIHHENISWNATTLRGDAWPHYLENGSGFKGAVNGSVSNPNSGFTSDWLTRWSLYDALNVDWDGCVEMRPWPHHTTDETPNSLNADTLYVPMFAPDEPVRKNNNEDYDYSNNYLNDYRRAYSNSLTYQNNNKHYLKTYIPGMGYNYGNYTRQNWRQNWAMKYNLQAKYSNVETSKSRDYGKYGPNMMCTTGALTPLSTSSTIISNAIGSMEAGGFTNIQAGLLWGWRSLSSSLPLDTGRTYDTFENDKYIILLTDGNNTYPNQYTNNQSQYTAWGYEKHNRVFDGTDSTSLVGAMNDHTLTTCQNIKAITDADNEPAYKIFTIAYDVPDGSSVKTLLHNCASQKENGSKYYYDVSGEALSAAMQAIGSEISDLRISE